MTTTIFDAYWKIMAKKPAIQHQPETLEFHCTYCKSKLAAIFQAEGDFCTECWQIVTHPKIEPR